MHERWARVVDAARQLGDEHRYKEREYGLKWRAAYKIELTNMAEELARKYGNPIEASMHWNGDQSELVYHIILKDYRAVMTYAAGANLEMMEMLTENLETFEATCKRLRAYLKN